MMLTLDECIMIFSIERKCPICERELESYDFFYENTELSTDMKKRIWLDERISIPCCKCCTLMIYFKEYCVDYDDLYSPNILVTFRNNNSRYIDSCILSPTQYSKLKELGLIK